MRMLQQFAEIVLGTSPSFTRAERKAFLLTTCGPSVLGVLILICMLLRKWPPAIIDFATTRDNIYFCYFASMTLAGAQNILVLYIELLRRWQQNGSSLINHEFVAGTIAMANITTPILWAPMTIASTLLSAPVAYRCFDCSLPGGFLVLSYGVVTASGILGYLTLKRR